MIEIKIEMNSNSLIWLGMVGLVAEQSRGQKSEIGNCPASLPRFFNIAGPDFPAAARRSN
jgi:hypothetical protein